MVDRDVSLRKAIDKLCDFTVSLNVEQRDAVASLLDGDDVVAVSPTGFGESPIFQVFVIAAEIERAISNRVSPLSLLSFPREILGIILTRGPRWRVETDVGSPLLVLKASGSSLLATSTFISFRTVTNLEFVLLIV